MDIKMIMIESDITKLSPELQSGLSRCAESTTDGIIIAKVDESLIKMLESSGITYTVLERMDESPVNTDPQVPSTVFQDIMNGGE